MTKTFILLLAMCSVCSAGRAKGTATCISPTKSAGYTEDCKSCVAFLYFPFPISSTLHSKMRNMDWDHCEKKTDISIVQTVSVPRAASSFQANSGHSEKILNGNVPSIKNTVRTCSVSVFPLHHHLCSEKVKKASVFMLIIPSSSRLKCRIQMSVLKQFQ